MARVWALLAAAGLFWSLLLAGAWRALEDGNRLLFALGRWFGEAPGELVWLTEILAEAGPAARLFLLLLWLAGLGFLVGVGWMVRRGR